MIKCFNGVTAVQGDFWFDQAYPENFGLSNCVLTLLVGLSFVGQRQQSVSSPQKPTSSFDLISGN